MKENYPRSYVWPYVGSGLLLIGLVLAPPTEWPRTLREIYERSTALFVADQIQTVHEPLIIAFDPQHHRPASSLSASKSKLLTAAEIKSQSVDGPSDVWPRQTVSNEPTLRSQNHANAQTESSSQSLAVSPPPDNKAPNFVWQPPHNWVPRPIQPHPAGDIVSTNNAQVVDPTLQYAPIELPVASLAIRSQPIASRSGRLVEPEADPSVIRFDSPSSHTDSGAKEQLEPIEDEPFQDEPSQGDHDPVNMIVETPGTSEALRGMDEHPSADANADRWPTSTRLHEMLADAYGDRVLAKWASEIRSTLGIVEGKRVSGTAEQVRAIARLKQLATIEVDRSQWPLHHRTLHNRIKLTVLRRVDVWEPLIQLANIEPSSFAKYRAHKQLARVASQLAIRLGSSRDTAEWSNYLSLQQLSELPGQQQQARDAAVITEDLPHIVLARLRSNQLDIAQQQFLGGTAFHDLEDSLRDAIAKSIHPSDVMLALEQYEEQPNRANANDVIDLLMRWRSSPQMEIYHASIGAITRNYRNANLRVSVSQEMINRLVPAIHQYADQVDDTILGAQVNGRNSTSANVSVQLIPDLSNIRLAFLANGNVQSNTASRKGPVTMFNQGHSTFSAGKELIIGPNGIHVTRTETRAATGNRIIGMRTDLDNIPFVGWIVRNFARQQHADHEPFLRAEILRRVKRSATQKIDREVHQRLANVEQRIGNRVVNPLRQMDLDPRAMEMRTTKDRLIMRTRLASSTQFGAHTPRPQARADSMMSFQIHQTAANNMIEQLNLQGRRMTLHELTTGLSKRLGIQLVVQNEDHLDTIIQFANDHPMEFEFENGQITMTIHLAELDTGKRNWKNFSARGYYRADVQKLDVELIRDEGIQLISERLGLRDQLALRSIFTKVLAKNTRLEVLTKAIQQQPRLQNLVVTQFTVRDGWMAVALGEGDRGMRLVERSANKDAATLPR